MCFIVVVGSFLALYSIPLAVALVCIGSGSVWLRGYVLPYTPRYGPLLARWLSILVGHSHDSQSTETDTNTQANPDGEQVLDALLAGGVLRDVGGNVEIDPEFHRAWKTEMRRHRDRTISELREAVEGSLQSENTGDVESIRLNDGSQYIVVSNGSGSDDISMSRPATIAELGAIDALVERLPATDREVLLAAATPLRGFLDTCPSCGSELVLSGSGRCCGVSRIHRNNAVLRCVECHIALYTH